MLERKATKMAGYGTLDLATRDGYDFAKFLNTIRLVHDSDLNKRHGVKLTRNPGTGHFQCAGLFRTRRDHDPQQPPMTMPFQFLPGEACTKDHIYPKYDVCIGDLSCEKGVGSMKHTETVFKIFLMKLEENGIRR